MHSKRNRWKAVGVLSRQFPNEEESQGKHGGEKDPTLARRYFYPW